METRCKDQSKAGQGRILQRRAGKGRAGQGKISPARLNQSRPPTPKRSWLPVVRVLDSDCQSVAVVELLLEGRLHGLRM